MEAGLSTIAAGGSKGSLAALGTSVLSLGSTTKAFVLSHPTTLGFVLGAGTVYGIGRMFKKRRMKKLLRAQEQAA